MKRYRYQISGPLMKRAQRAAKISVIKTRGNPNAVELGKNLYEAELMGVLGEAAAALHYGSLPRWTGAYDGGYDFETPTGMRFNAKSVRWEFLADPILKVRPCVTPSDNYVLCVVDWRRGLCELAGWTTRVDLALMGNVGGRGFTNDTRWLDEGRLLPLPDPSDRGILLQKGWSPLVRRGTVLWCEGSSGHWTREEEALRTLQRQLTG